MFLDKILFLNDRNGKVIAEYTDLHGLETSSIMVSNPACYLRFFFIFSLILNWNCHGPTLLSKRVRWRNN
jgi:hypothetical protein